MLHNIGVELCIINLICYKFLMCTPFTETETPIYTNELIFFL